LAISIKDVAERAGVSTATVSHVLNGTRKISPATHSRVMAAVEVLGYSINRAARNLAMGRRSSLLGVLISDIRNPFFPEIVASFQDQALLQQLEALVLNTNYDPARMVDCVNRLLGLQVAGAAVFTSQFDPRASELLQGAGVPTVYLDVGSAGSNVSNIVIDYEHGIAEGLEHLRSLGHRSIGYVGGPVHLASAQRRKRAFIETAGRLGLTPVAAIDADFSVTGGYDATRRLLEGNRPTAIMASNDISAIGSLHAAYELGLSVPRDLSICGFDDIEFARHSQPPLTTVAIPREELGRVGFEAVDRMLRHPDHAGEELQIRTRLILRQSTAPPRKS
jgi:LacI family transcriptional regulator